MIRRLVCAATLSLFIILAAHAAAPPRLVVVISLDQFPYEYLVRFDAQIGSGGFRRLMEQGASFSNACYGHAVNLTGPGHAVILSGAYGNQNGIITNSWYDLNTHATAYCVDDKTVSLVGAQGKGRSPANFIGSTYGDELRLVSGFRSKVVSMSQKDRAAILLGGRMANAAYWMSDSSFVTSSYYTESLPDWVRRFNASGLANSFFGRTWDQTLPETAFAGLDVDDAPYENGGKGLGRVFPHPITGNDKTRITPSYYHDLIASPFGSDLLTEFARAAIAGEQLGKRGVTDLLCISYSSHDYVGHDFGPHSREVLELTVKTDAMLTGLLSFLDAEFGAGNYLIALTSDHAVAPIPEYIKKHFPRADAGRVHPDSITGRCEGALSAKFGTPPQGMRWIERSVDRNIYFDRRTLSAMKVAEEDAARGAAAGLLRLRGVAAAYTRGQMESPSMASALEIKVHRSYHPLRSGDLFFAMKPYFVEGSGSSGTSHGEPYDYSAHVPMIIAGSGVKPGVYAVETSPVDLAPTLSILTGVELPAGREGRVLREALK